MLSFYRKYYKTIFDIGLIVGTIFLVMWLFSLFYNIAAPIFFAFVIFVIIEPLARFLHNKGMKKIIATTISMLLMVAILLSLIVGGGVVFVNQLATLTQKIPEYSAMIQTEITKQVEYFSEQYNGLDEKWTDKISDYSAGAAERIASFLKWFLSNLLSRLTSFSGFILNVLIGMILAYFLSLEITQWKKFAKKKTPDTFKNIFYFLKNNVLKGIAAYIKAQLLLISITFCIIFAALLVLRVDNAFTLSLMAAFFDLLPLLGVTTLFLPWIIYLLFVSQYTLAIYLAALLLVVILSRQILEPKIVGDSLGVSAFTMLSFMIISLSLFGFAGLILSPILIILLKELYVQGHIKSWIRAPEDYSNNRKDD